MHACVRACVQLPKLARLRSLRIPHCDDGNATATDFRNDRTAPPSQAANQSTSVKLCWDTFGMQ